MISSEQADCASWTIGERRTDRRLLFVNGGTESLFASDLLPQPPTPFRAVARGSAVRPLRQSVSWCHQPAFIAGVSALLQVAPECLKTHRTVQRFADRPLPQADDHPETRRIKSGITSSHDSSRAGKFSPTALHKRGPRAAPASRTRPARSLAERIFSWWPLCGVRASRTGGDKMVAGFRIHDLATLPQSHPRPDMSHLPPEFVLEAGELWSLSRGAGRTASRLCGLMAGMLRARAVLIHPLLRPIDMTGFYREQHFADACDPVEWPFAKTLDGGKSGSSPCWPKASASKRGFAWAGKWFCNPRTGPVRCALKPRFQSTVSGRRPAGRGDGCCHGGFECGQRTGQRNHRLLG